MKIVTDSKGNKYIDQPLKDYINNIWISFDVTVNNNSNIYFLKNTTIPRIISDYSGMDIHRVIKRDKADYVIIDKFDINEYSQYFDGVNITEDDTKEVVYGIYNESMEVQDTIEAVLDFHIRAQPVVYVNQNKLNDSINNGFKLDSESYLTIKQLVDSEQVENHKLAISMVVNSDLKSNWEWLIYIYFNKFNQIQSYDKNNIIINYYSSLSLGVSLATVLAKIDSALKVIKDKDVSDRFIHMIKDGFLKNINAYFSTLGTNKFELDDFKIRYNASK